MKKLVMIASVLTFAACSQSEAPATQESPEAVETPRVAITPGFYETMNSEGTIGGAELMDDGSYRTFDRNGTDTGNGTWTNFGRRSCFDPSGDDPAICYTGEEPDADGRFDATSDGGVVITVRPVADASEIGAR